MERVRKSLEGLQAQVEKGELKAADKIGAAAASKLRRHHGHRYFAWELRQGKFRFFEHPLNLRREKALEGKYVIQTEEPHLTPLQAVAAYKQLNEVERAFAQPQALGGVATRFPSARGTRAGSRVRGRTGAVSGSGVGEGAADSEQRSLFAGGLAGAGNHPLRGSGLGLGS